MKKSKRFIPATLLVILLVGMSACSHTSDKTTATKNQSESDNISESTDDSTESNDSSTDNTVKSDDSVNTSNKLNETIQEDKTSKIEGRRNEFIERLDNIQIELDAMPEKKDSDNGITNAMKNYYGVSFERYDKILNEIYALLQKELSPETTKDLKNEQMKWIEQKEDRANEERLKYKGGTFENVAYYISLYNSTKERSYELVNTYMTD
ncbi:lysozyme inhibitor LprI family protein [Neobacillus sp. OS1-2]|uniref:lysozyme inhibitor LprI family protein n=1 Tax=Neobacillus sp. OS1-2 TaxID=3070680 RepID=UPI0027E0DEA9|nr:lysozyme inhibitor LprI family protein [Neobacillus sp. OS1-2]WML38134.1 lysozyme inhibitor LprI family protein [Neobacillus sp. OS1-2]